MRSPLARTSAAAGKTRLANLYRVTVEGGPGGPGRWSLYFADLPGYGYARGGSDSVTELARIAAAYFEDADAPRRERSSTARYRVAGVLHLVDSRHPGLAPDIEAANWLDATGLERASWSQRKSTSCRALSARRTSENWNGNSEWLPCRSRHAAAKDWTICGD